jgi:prepilin-type N-terminal cleavage/methylation domain-containing protein
MRNKNGFTLLETLIVVAILGVVSITLANMVIYIYRTNKSVFRSVSALEGKEQMVMTVLRELRGATYGPSGEWPLVTAQDSNIAFYLYTESGNVLREYALPDAMRFHYFDALGAELPKPVDVQNVARVGITASSTSIGSAALRNLRTH